MSAKPAAWVQAVGMLTPVGTGAKASAAAIDAGVARLTESDFYDDRFRPIVLGQVPDDELPAAVPALASQPPLVQRLVRLAAPALAECAADLPRPESVPVFVALPETPGTPEGAAFLRLLAAQSGVPFALATSRAFPLGRAGALVALEAALELLAEGDVTHAFVGGVDSHSSQARLDALVAEGRVLADGVMDGFVPGEGAGFVLLRDPAARPGGARPLARIEAVASAQEPGHRGSKEPFRGEGLAAAFARAWGGAPAELPAVRTTWAGFNGEGLFAKEWGTAYARHADRIAEDAEIRHPAECFGDTGAAFGALLVGFAALALAEGAAAGLSLVWSSSDGAPRAAALLGAAER